MIPLFKVAMAEGAAAEVEHVLNSGYIGQGEGVERFETELHKFIGGHERPLAVSSGTHALDLAYHMIGLGQGDVVITTPLTCTATVTPLINRGCRLVFADIDEYTGCIDPRSVADCLKSYPAVCAIVAVDWGGTLCDYPALRRAVEAGGTPIPIVQDAAHSMGAHVYGTRLLDSEMHGDYVMFSFQAIKQLTTGDGGALVCPHYESYARAKLLRWFGLDREGDTSFRCKQRLEEAGYKYHMNDISAAIGLCNLAELRGVCRAHQENAFSYSCAFADLQLGDHGIASLQYQPGSAYWLYTMLATERDKFTVFMTERGIATSPVHNILTDMPCVSRATVEDVAYRAAEFAARHVCIPVGSWLTVEDLNKICDTVREYANA